MVEKRSEKVLVSNRHSNESEKKSSRLPQDKQANRRSETMIYGCAEYNGVGWEVAKVAITLRFVGFLSKVIFMRQVDVAKREF
jgi:hypothetical protein